MKIAKRKIFIISVILVFSGFFLNAQQLYVGVNYHPHDDKNIEKIKSDIQLMKAGLIEIGDIVAVNKADKSGAEDTVRDISMHIGDRKQNGWKVPVVTVQSISGEGVEGLKNHLDAHFSFLRENTSGVQKKKERLLLSKQSLPEEELKARLGTLPSTRKFVEAISKPRTISLIAEIKRSSPSRGVIREDFHLQEIARTYQEAEVPAVSVLTEED